MKNITPFLLLLVLFSACAGKQQSSTTCPIVLACPAIAIGPLLITYVDNTNSPVVVKDFHVVDLRTNKTITISSTVMLSPGTYGVADYSDKKLFSTDGDNLQITATDTLTHQTKIVLMKVAGGLCACDITKISGPDTVKFN